MRIYKQITESNTQCFRRYKAQTRSNGQTTVPSLPFECVAETLYLKSSWTFSAVTKVRLLYRSEIDDKRTITESIRKMILFLIENFEAFFRLFIFMIFLNWFFSNLKRVEILVIFRFFLFSSSKKSVIMKTLLEFFVSQKNYELYLLRH